MTSEYIDINQLRKQNALLAAQEKIGAFGNRNQKKAMPLSPKSQARIQEQRKKERTQYDDYLKLREDRISKKPNPGAMFKNLVCNEKNHLNQSAYDNPVDKQKIPSKPI